MNPLKRDSPDNSVPPPISIVLVNPKINDSFSDEHRRLIAKISPVCYAYNFHLVLVNFKIDVSPIDFATEMAHSTSIGKSGERLIELAKNSKISIGKLPLSINLGKIIICTSRPNLRKILKAKKMASIVNKEKIALVFGCDKKRNKNVRKLMQDAEYHFDISEKGIELSLDSEIGAVTSIIQTLK